MGRVATAQAALLDAIVLAADSQDGQNAEHLAAALERVQYAVEPTVEEPQPANTDERDPDGRVLAWVNETRAAYNLGEPLAVLPPDADPAASITKSCPIARALLPEGFGCGYDAIQLRNADGSPLAVIYDVPQFVQRFMDDHDSRVARVG